MRHRQPTSNAFRPLAPRERAELSRQGAKAAARGDLASSNPMGHPHNDPLATGESQATWTERHDAWLAGHELQATTVRGGRAWSAPDEHD
jgi:hypothetical protein